MATSAPARPTKITSGEMRDSGVRGILIFALSIAVAELRSLPLGIDNSRATADG